MNWDPLIEPHDTFLMSPTAVFDGAASPAWTGVPRVVMPGYAMVDPSRTCQDGPGSGS